MARADIRSPGERETGLPVMGKQGEGGDQITLGPRGMIIIDVAEVRNAVITHGGSEEEDEDEEKVRAWS